MSVELDEVALPMKPARVELHVEDEVRTKERRFRLHPRERTRSSVLVSARQHVELAATPRGEEGSEADVINRRAHHLAYRLEPSLMRDHGLGGRECAREERTLRCHRLVNAPLRAKRKPTLR
jgi:hypothetical protein